jgi:cytochrome c oxidase cbb3-type subunit 3
MSGRSKSIGAIALLIAALLTVSCARAPDAMPASNSAAQSEAPPAARYQDHIWAAGVAPPAGELSRPQSATPPNPKDGQALFNSMNCDGCHSSDGSGYVGPSLSDGRWRYGGGDEEIFNSIFYGRPEGMPAYGGVLGQGGVWLVMAYLKSLPKPKSVPTVSLADAHGHEGHPGLGSATGGPAQ